MWDWIVAMMGLLLALYGVAELIVRFCWRVLFAGEDAPLIFTVTVDDTAEYRLRRLAAWVRLCPKGFTPRVVLSEPSPLLFRLCEELGFAVESPLQDTESAL